MQHAESGQFSQDSTALKALVTETLNVLSHLNAAIEAETASLRIGKIREGVAMAETKKAVSERYSKLLQQLQRDIAHIGGIAPEALAELRHRHGLLEQRLSVNLAVVTTTLGISEGILKELSSRIAAKGTPKTYGPPGTARASAASAPLSLSRST